MHRDNLVRTASLCPVCLSLVPATREVQGQEAFLVKTCPDHGSFKTLIWSGPPSIESWSRPKVPMESLLCQTSSQAGCPFDCGLCPAHRQKTCAALIEVTACCNLNCPVCYARAASKSGADPSLATITGWYRSIKEAGGICSIQLSGGEPTVRDDLPEIVETGRSLGFSFIQVNTNGLRLAQEKGYARRLKGAGLAAVFLQFDGTEENIHQTLRGRSLLAEKLAAIEECSRAELGLILVPTLMSGVNVHNIGDILNLGRRLSPAVRGVHFQPISYFGRYPHPPGPADHVTLPEIIRAIESQTDGLMRAEHFRPPGCENALCSFHGNFLLWPGGQVQALTGSCGPSCGAAPEKAEEGARRSVAFVARQWPAPGSSGTVSAESLASRTAMPSASIEPDQPISLDAFLDQARAATFSVSAMAFQDVWNLDIERLRDCCIHVVAPDGRLIPFCAYNLTSLTGRALYRNP